MSWARPWARFSSKDVVLEKMTEMEKTIINIPNVQKVHIMQGWREIYVFINPENTKDEDLDDFLRTIATKIEEKLDYPWIIRVSMIREKRIMTFLK
jgi:ribonuclease Y